MTSNAERPNAPSDEVKAKFREALDRKRSTQHRTEEGEANTGGVHSSETAGPVQRTFRRKSG